MLSSCAVPFIVCSLLQFHVTDAGILPLTLPKPNDKAHNNLPAAPTTNLSNFGYIEFQPNGTLILRSTMENGTNLQNLLLFRTVLNAIQLAPLMAATKATSYGGGSIKIYGEGVEHKFPPFLERVLQRVQSYFSVYKYADTSRPVTEASTSTTSTTSSLTPPATATLPSTTQAETVDSLLAATVTTVDNNDAVDLDDDLQHTTFVDIGSDAVEQVTDEYAEFISIGDNDGYISVGED